LRRPTLRHLLRTRPIPRPPVPPPAPLAAATLLHPTAAPPATQPWLVAGDPTLVGQMPFRQMAAMATRPWFTLRRPDPATRPWLARCRFAKWPPWRAVRNRRDIHAEGSARRLLVRAV